MRWPLPALAAAAIALLLSIVAAWGPSRHESTRYSWPATPTSGGMEVAGAELLLTRHEAAKIEVTVPCARETVGSGSWLFKTVVHPDVTPGLLVASGEAGLFLSVGSESTGMIPWGADRACQAEVVVEERIWQVQIDGRTVADGEFGRAPVVSALMAPSDLVAAQPPLVSAHVDTKPHSTSPSSWQLLAWGFTVAALAHSVTRVARGRGWARRHRLTADGLRRVASQVCGADVLVFGIVVSWAVLSHTFDDDGWTLTIAEQWAPSGGEFRWHYERFDAIIPIGSLLYFVYMGVGAVSGSILWLRIPSILFCLGAWILVRWCASRLVGRPPQVVLWTMAGAYSLGCVSWLITLRAEPLVALLVVATLACSINFVETLRMEWLAAGGLLAAVGLSVHTTGLLVLAPLAALLPTIVRKRLRSSDRDLAALATIAFWSASALLFLVFFDSDVRAWASNYEEFARTGVHGRDWSDEFERYAKLLANWSTPPRRLIVFAGLVASASYLMRNRQARDEAIDLPGRALVIAFCLLALTPSKWPWHFGALVALTSFALAVEVWRASQAEAVDRLPRTWRLAGLFLVALLVAGPGWVDWMPDLATWLAAGLVVALASGAALSMRTRERPVISVGIACGLVVALPIVDFPKFGWILIGGCAIWFAMSGSEVRIPALLRVGQWLIPVLLVMTGIEAIWTAFHRRLYVPGGVGRVMKRIGGFAIGQRWQIIGVLLLLLAACLIALVLRRFAVGRRRLQVGAVLLVPLAGLFSTLVIWDGLQSSYWSVARQNLWPVFGESACGSGETAGYVDPALARDLTESGHEREIPVALPDSLQPLDLMGRFPASVPATELRTMLVGDDAKHALFAHAPSVVEVPLDQIVDGRLHFGYGIVGDEPYGEDPSDGVTFLIVAERESGDSDVLYRDTLDPSTDASHPDWKHGWADLTHADDPIRGLSLVTEEVGNENYDWSAWTSLSFLSADRQQLVGDMRADAAAPGTPLPSGKVYGSLVAGSGAAEVGWFTTPWYEVPAGTTSLFVEVAGQLSPEGNSLFVQTLVQGDDGTRVLKERRLEQRVDDPRWRLTAVDIPPGTTETRLIGIDQSRDVNGWLGVGTPAAFPAAVTVQDSVARGATPVLMNPYIRPWFPCLEQAPLAGGRAQAPGLQISPMNDASSPVRFADDVYTYYTSGANRPIRRVLAPGFDDVPWSASPIWD